MSDSRWFFTEDQLANARKCKFTGETISLETDLCYRQDASQFIQEMGQRLRVSQLCINSAIVYFHRFYAFHPFTIFHRHDIAAAAFFLAAKVEEHPRKASDIVKVLGMLMEPYNGGKKMREEDLARKFKDLVVNENILVQTLGFDTSVVHPHIYVVQALSKLRSLPNFQNYGKVFYFMATTTLHLTTMCLKYPPSLVAASCIDITCRWQKYDLPELIDGKAWYELIDESITKDQLKKLRVEFFDILEKSSPKNQAKIEAIMTSEFSEIPKPPVSHRSEQASNKTLQEIHKNHQNGNHIPKKHDSSSSSWNFSAKQPRTENQQNLKKNASSESFDSTNLMQKPSHQLQSTVQIENSGSYENYSPISEDSRDSMKEPSQDFQEIGEISRKRKFTSMSDGELLKEENRETKLRKVEEFQSLPQLTETSNGYGSVENFNGSDSYLNGSVSKFHESVENSHGSASNVGSFQNFHGSLPNFHGSQLNLHGSQSNFHGSQPNFHGSQPNFHEHLSNLNNSTSNFNSAAQRIKTDNDSMNLVNCTLTILPSEPASFDQMYLPPTDNNDYKLFNFKSNFTGDFNNNDGKMNAGC